MWVKVVDQWIRNMNFANPTVNFDFTSQTLTQTLKYIFFHGQYKFHCNALYVLIVQPTACHSFHFNLFYILRYYPCFRCEYLSNKIYLYFHLHLNGIPVVNMKCIQIKLNTFLFQCNVLQSKENCLVSRDESLFLCIHMFLLIIFKTFHFTLKQMAKNFKGGKTLHKEVQC